MSKCELTGKGPVVKNVVSHSNIKTKSRALPNIQAKRFFSHQLNEFVKLKVATSTIRDIDKQGNFDNFIMKQSLKNLSSKASTVKKRILKKMNKKPKASQEKQEKKV
ncbi:MAG: 50S ribosomal protein L28 [Bdellovibrionales bacterium]